MTVATASPRRQLINLLSTFAVVMPLSPFLPYMHLSKDMPALVLYVYKNDIYVGGDLRREHATMKHGRLNGWEARINPRL